MRLRNLRKHSSKRLSKHQRIAASHRYLPRRDSKWNTFFIESFLNQAGFSYMCRDITLISIWYSVSSLSLADALIDGLATGEAFAGVVPMRNSLFSQLPT